MVLIDLLYKIRFILKGGQERVKLYSFHLTKVMIPIWLSLLTLLLSSLPQIHTRYEQIAKCIAWDSVLNSSLKCKSLWLGCNAHSNGVWGTNEWIKVLLSLSQMETHLRSECQCVLRDDPVPYCKNIHSVWCPKSTFTIFLALSPIPSHQAKVGIIISLPYYWPLIWLSNC